MCKWNFQYLLWPTTESISARVCVFFHLLVRSQMLEHFTWIQRFPFSSFCSSRSSDKTLFWGKSLQIVFFLLWISNTPGAKKLMINVFLISLYVTHKYSWAYTHVPERFAKSRHHQCLTDYSTKTKHAERMSQLPNFNYNKHTNEYIQLTS